MFTHQSLGARTRWRTLAPCEGAHTQVGGLLPPVEAAGVWAGYPILDACLQVLNQVYPQ